MWGLKQARLCTRAFEEDGCSSGPVVNQSAAKVLEPDRDCDGRSTGHWGLVCQVQFHWWKFIIVLFIQYPYDGIGHAR